MLGRRNFSTFLKGSLVAALLTSVTAIAEDVPEKSPPGDLAVKSLQDVLQKAARQGLVDYKDDAQPTSEDSTDTQLKMPDTKVLNQNFVFTSSCQASKVLDLNMYQTVSSYDDISAAKAGIEPGNNRDQLLPLLKTYMALGLGAEMTSAVNGFKDAEARLVGSMGRTIDGQPTEEDQKLIASYADCSENMSLLNIFSQISSSSRLEEAYELNFGRENLAALEELPSELRDLISLKIGTAAAEQENDVLAQRLLTFIAPETKYGDRPATNDPAVLYFYALVKNNSGDPVGTEIFQHLAQHDGIYRVRSLRKLSEENFDNNLVLYDNFTQDLESVTQQYSGQGESLEASLQIVLQRLQNGKFVEAISKAKQDLGRDDLELAKAVRLIAQRLETRLEDVVKSIRLDALAAFVYDPVFFKSYENLDSLTTMAVSTAIDLNLPELVPTILDAGDLSFKVDKTTLDFAKASIATKHGDFDAALQIASSYKEDPRFEPLFLEAAIQSEKLDLATKILGQRPADKDRFSREADLAWEGADWTAVQVALKAKAKSDPEESYTDEISLMTFLGQESQNYVDREPPVSAGDLETLKMQLDNDISLVKRLLSNG